jgi:dsDNA-specific endonuclease/ATPase MutS2
MTDPVAPAPLAPKPPAPRPSNTEVQRYIDSAMRKLDESPESLESYERRLLGKIKKASQAAQEAVKGAQDMKNQIAQAEARMRSLELQAENHQGSVNAYIDEIVSVKFNVEEPFTAPPTPPKSVEAPADTDAKSKKLKAVKGDAHPSSN